MHDSGSHRGPDEEDAQACPACHGTGTVLMSMCCGRGCATCPGEDFMQTVECYRCHGKGRLAAREPGREDAGGA